MELPRYITNGCQNSWNAQKISRIQKHQNPTSQQRTILLIWHQQHVLGVARHLSILWKQRVRRRIWNSHKALKEVLQDEWSKITIQGIRGDPVFLISNGVSPLGSNAIVSCPDGPDMEGPTTFFQNGGHYLILQQRLLRRRELPGQVSCLRRRVGCICVRQVV